jgi:flagellar L-ring protein precursor FlgH
MSCHLGIRIALLASLPLLGACTSFLERLASVGAPPAMSAIENPGNKPPVVMPQPRPVAAEGAPSSLWRPGARAFFKDQRASQVGDIVTVNINIADTASLANSTERERTSTEAAGLASFLGFDVGRLVKRLPGRNNNTVTPDDLVDASSSSKSTGTGTIERKETITLKVAAVVTQVLPNGNLVVQGSQEVRVNHELRALQVAGVVRPQDIRSTNEIPHERLAEARISYGGKGTITDMQKPRWGQEIYELLFPF